jgi:amino acid transporter
MLAAIPSGDLDIVEGLMDTLFLLFKDVPYGEEIVYVLGTCSLFTFFSNGATWAMGCNRAAAEAARDGQLPKIFAYQRGGSNGPTGAAIMMGCVCSLVLIVYGAIASSNEDLFWSLFAFSAVIFMLTYIGMALAFIKLRYKEPHMDRPYKVPGGNRVAVLAGGIVALILAISISMFIYVPEEGLSVETLIGLIVAVLLGEALIRTTNRSKA